MERKKEKYLLGVENIISKKLLADNSTGKNIVWATDMYNNYGNGLGRDNQMLIEDVIMLYKKGILVPRILKPKDEQVIRSKKNAEVFTPAWIINKMNNYCDTQWFDSKNVFNVENDDNTWTYLQHTNSFYPSNYYLIRTCFHGYPKTINLLSLSNVLNL